MTSPLHLAVEHGSQEVVDALISEGGEIDAQDGRGRTPLHVAAEHLRCDTFDLLVREGANESILDDEGMSAAVLKARSRLSNPFLC